jgi:small nuclear ribonucleoprotein
MPDERPFPTMTGRPLDVLEESLGEDVTVRLKSGELYEGRLGGYDQHMNLVLEVPVRIEADEDAGTSPVEDGETTIIRGDNLVSITT